MVVSEIHQQAYMVERVYYITGVLKSVEVGMSIGLYVIGGIFEVFVD